MKNYLVLIFSAIITIIINSGCKKSAPTEEGNSPIQSSVKLSYQKLCTAPNPNAETTMILNYDNKIIIAGDFYIQAYDTVSKTWQSRYIAGDSIARRWDGAICRLNNSVYLFGAPWNFSKTDWFKVVKMDPATLNTWWLPEPLPFTSYAPYPAYTTYNNKMIAVFPTLDSVYVFDGATEKGKFVAPNIAKYINLYTDKIFISGVHNDSLYIFNVNTLSAYRLSLATYEWNEIHIPDEIKIVLEQAPIVGGGIWGNQFLILRESNSVYYDFSKQQWSWVNNDIDDSHLASEHCCKTPDALYYLSFFDLIVWKITKNN